MRHRIDPKVDCVFKALLGSEDNKNLLIHFLNAILEPKTPISDVYILDPSNAREFVGDKSTIVDVKARQEDGDWFQVEMQVQVHAFLSERQLFTWANLYRGQLRQGETYMDLRPAISIWLLNGLLFPDSPVWHHRFRAIDSRTGHQLSEHFAIHVLELPKWKFSTDHLDDAGQWMYFFKTAENWLELPKELKTPEMEQAMSTLKIFSEKQIEYHRYLSRQDAERTRQLIDRTNKEQMERNKQEMERNKQEMERNKQEMERNKQWTAENIAKEQELAAQEQELAAQEQELAAQEQEIATKDQALTDQELKLQAKARALREREAQIEQSLAKLRAQGLLNDESE